MRGKRWEGGEEGIGDVVSERRECNLLYHQDFRYSPMILGFRPLL